MPAAKPTFEFSDAATVARHASAYGLPAAAVVQLVAIDRVLRTLAVLEPEPSKLLGYVLGGPAAVLGVYGREALLRVPDEVTLIPISDASPHTPDRVAGLAAGALPGGSASPGEETGTWTLAFDGPDGRASLRLRIETVPVMIPLPHDTLSAAATGPGWLADDRLPYRSHMGAPIVLPVAAAEELLLRTVRALALAGRTDGTARLHDLAERSDDFRIILALYPDATPSVMRGAVRERLTDLLRNPAGFERWIAGFVAAVGSGIASASRPETFVSQMRPDTDRARVGREEALAYERSSRIALTALLEGAR